jgi:hypothetical protein
VRGIGRRRDGTHLPSPITSGGRDVPQLPFTRSRAQAQQEETLARLAATDVVSLVSRGVEQSAPADRLAARDRVRHRFLGDQAPDDVAEDLLDVLVTVLRDAEVDINFNAAKFFYNKKIPDKYTQQFERAGWGGAAYLKTRDEVEQKMFHYAGGTGGARGDADQATRTAGHRIQTLGTSDSDDFAPSIRPRYVTLNFAKVQDGMGAQWGRSHFVLSDHLKPNMTFIHTDSFDVANQKPPQVQSEVTYYGNVTRLICYMSEGMLDALHNAALGYSGVGLTRKEFEKVYAVGTTNYVEGHLHAEVYFNRDVDKMRLCTSEVYGCEELYNKLKWDPITPAELKKHIERFRQKHSLDVIWFD